MTFDLSRRTVLQIGAASTAALPLGALAQGGDTPRAQGQPMPDGVNLPKSPPKRPGPDSVGYAIIGLGGYALNQVMPAFADTERSHVAALVSGNRDKARRVAGAYGVPEDAAYGYDDFARIAADDRVDAVYIILPSGLHADWTEKAFAAGKHVMCEKPMALSIGACDRMIAAAKAADRKLMIGYRCHFEPANLEAMALMRDGAIGAPRVIRTDQTYRAGPTSPEENWRFNRALAGGGPLEDYGIYGLQSAMYLTGETPQSVSASSWRPKDDPRFREIVASTQSQLNFPSGAMAQCFTSYDTSGLNRVAARGTDSALTMEPATSYRGNTVTVGGERVRTGASAVQFARQVDHLSQAIREGTEIITPGEMGRRDVVLMEAIYHAAASGERVAVNL